MNYQLRVDSVNLIRIQIAAIRKSLRFQKTTSVRPVTAVAEKYAAVIRLLEFQEDNRDVPQFEMERDRFFQEREQELPEEYPFQDFNYGP